MLLKDFIEETLTSIAEGIAQSQKKLAEFGVEVAPPEIDQIESVTPEHVPIYTIEFEVELIESMSTKGKKGIGVAFPHIGIGVSKESGDDNASTTNIKFKIPMTYPCRHTMVK